MSNSIIQSYYKRNDLNHIEELIMRVTNYAWTEMTLTQQGELREKAAAEFAATQARIEKLEAGIKLAQSKLRSTQINWQEDCLFDCDDILTNTLKGDE